MTIAVRLARISDAEAISRLTAELGYEADAALVEARLARILDRSEQQFWKAEVDGAPAGGDHAVVAEFVEAEAFVTIGGLVVDSRYRRHGVGRQLMQQAETWARQQGCSLVRLSSSITRAAAHRFYGDVGYTNIKTQYSFIKPLDETARERLAAFVPRVDV
jgi:GNAT superfamily N-acetyltransferase